MPKVKIKVLFEVDASYAMPYKAGNKQKLIKSISDWFSNFIPTHEHKKGEWEWSLKKDPKAKIKLK
jgi:hypothetical protein